jgi:hypothetical protein
MADAYRPGWTVPASGIYTVVHDPSHVPPHEVTCIEGRTFPPCRGCEHPRFKLKYAAQHIDTHEQFHQSPAARRYGHSEWYARR